MSDLSFATTVEAESEESSNEEIEAEPNETCDIYLSGGDAKNAAGSALANQPVPEGAKYTEKDDDGNTHLSELKINGSDDLEDADRLIEKYHDAEPQQLLNMVLALMKSTFGAMTANKNKHGVGLNNDGKPQTDADYASYADHHRGLEAVNWSSLTEAERELFENIGVDAGDLGFDPKHRGPKLLHVNGERLPVVATEGNEHKQLLSILADLPEVPSYDHEEDGFVESSDPSVFDAESEKGGDLDEASEMADNLDSDDEADEEDLKLASNPERITEASTTQLRGGVNNLTNITNSRVLMKMKSVEENNENRSTVVDRLEERIAAEGDYGDDEADGEADEAEADEDVEITIDDVEEIFGFGDIQMSAVKHKASNGMTVSEAAQEVADA